MLRSTVSVVLGLGALLAGPVQGAAPYPPSTLITGMRWDTATYRWTGSGGDIWPTTWAADGSLVTAWGDGVVGCRQKASYGVAAIASDLPGTGLAIRHCGPGPQGKGKMMALLAAGDLLYARMAPQSTGSGYPIWRSSDGGRSWAKPAASLPFLIDAFVQFGKGNAGAPGGYVYALERRGSTAIHLLRVAPGSAQTSAAYEYFSGSATSPAWTRNRSSSRAYLHRPCRRDTTQHHLRPRPWPLPLGRRPREGRRAVERPDGHLRGPRSLGSLAHRALCRGFPRHARRLLPRHALPDQVARRTAAGRYGRYSPATTWAHGGRLRPVP